MRRIVILMLVTTAAVATAAVALAAASPKAVRASIVAAALAQTSVHWTSTATGLGIVTRTADVNADSGTEQATFNHAGTVQILLVNDTAYVEGDAVGLQFSLNLTQAQAAEYADQWISIPKGDPLYAATTDGLTLASIVRDATPRGKLKLSRTKSHGTRLLVVRATSRKVTGGVSRVAAQASGKPLPVAFSDGGLAHSWRGAFSEWNESVSVQAPASSTPIATVRGS